MLLGQNGVEERLRNSFVQAEEEPAWCREEAGRVETQEDEEESGIFLSILSSINNCNATRVVESDFYMTVLFVESACEAINPI